MTSNNQRIHEFGPFRYYEEPDGVVLRYTPQAAAADGAAPIDVRFEHDGAVYVENSTDRSAMLDADGSLALYVGDENGKHGVMCGSDDSVTVLRPDGSQIYVAPDGTVSHHSRDEVIDRLINGYEDGEQA